MVIRIIGAYRRTWREVNPQAPLKKCLSFYVKLYNYTFVV